VEGESWGGGRGGHGSLPWGWRGVRALMG
jgi:hypothetical protein